MTTPAAKREERQKPRNPRIYTEKNTGARLGIATQFFAIFVFLRLGKHKSDRKDLKEHMDQVIRATTAL